jgi:osmotically-inducible protein OsmY
MSKLLLFTITLFGSLSVFADDATIKTCVVEHLTKAKSLTGETITVTVKDNAVTLTGQVKDARKKGTATRVAKAKVCGASTVKNELTAIEPLTIRKAKP